MRWLTAAAISAALTMSSSSLPATTSDDDGIAGTDIVAGTNGENLDVTGTKTSTGSDKDEADSDTNSGSGGGIQDAGYVPPPRRTAAECLANWNNMISCWEFINPPEEGEDPDDSTPAIPEITITDLATFSPDPGILSGEPNNLGVAGLPANFTTDADVHTRSGTLFGFPIQVRFTPATYTFHYGDGESRASDDAGASWDELGLAQFTPTDTSHSYAERGTYDASVDVSYTAEIDLGVGWFPIDGQLTIDGATQQIRIYEAHTALVARTCDEQPTAPGC